MRIRLTFLALVALGVIGLGASGSVAASQANVPFIFRGELIADPPSGSASLLLDVEGGNRRALRLMVGQSSAQSFAVGPNTQYLRWSRGVPTVVSQDNLAEGDQLTIRVRAPRSSSLAQVESTPAALVSDHGPNPGRAAKPLWLFQGTLNAPASGGRVSIHVIDGNYRALKAMLGQALDQSFAYNRRTVFIRWQGRTPTLISPSQLTVGARINVRIRARGNSSLAQVRRRRRSTSPSASPPGKPHRRLQQPCPVSDAGHGWAGRSARPRFGTFLRCGGRGRHSLLLPRAGLSCSSPSTCRGSGSPSISRSSGSSVDPSSRSLHLFAGTESLEGWDSGVAPAAALAALLLVALSAVAYARPGLVARLPLGRCALVAAFFAVAVAAGTRSHAMSLTRGAEANDAVGLQAQAAYGTYVGLGAVAVTLIAALLLRRAEVSAYRSPAVAGALLVLGLLVAFLLPWMRFDGFEYTGITGPAAQVAASSRSACRRPGRRPSV